jgi:hypothetical protein
METTHDNRPATIYVTETSIYATYDDDDDVFFHVELDDDSVDLAVDLTNEFGEETANEILAEVGVI